MTEPNNPHDALFKQVFSNTESTAELLRAVLPPRLLSELSLGTLALCPASFVDSALASSHSDLLFSVSLSRGSAFVYLLFEHQSSVDLLMPLWVVRYMVRIWEAHVGEQGRGRQALPLPVVIPIVLHHSETGWTAATRLEELFDRDWIEGAELGELVPRLAFLLDDLSQLSDEALRKRALGLRPTLALWALRDARSPVRLAASFAHWLDVLEKLAAAPSGKEALFTIFRYLSLVADNTVARTILTTLHTRTPHTEDALMTTLAEQWLAEGRAEGEARARAAEAEARAAEAEARAAEIRARAASVLAVLETRNLPLSGEQRARIESCSEAELLDRWLRAAVTASDANELFSV